MNWKELLQKLLWQRGERLAEKCGDISKQGQPVVQNYAIFDLEGYDYTQIFSIERKQIDPKILRPSTIITFRLGLMRFFCSEPHEK